MSKVLHAGSVQAMRTQAQSVTAYSAVGSGHTANANTTESNTQSKARTAGTYSALFLISNTNTLSVSTTVRFRKNGANGNQTFTITTTAVGTFTDASNTDAVVATDETGISVATAAGSGSITIHQIGCLFEATGNTVIRYANVNANGNTFSVSSTSTPFYLGFQPNNGDAEPNLSSKFLTSGTLKNLYVRVTSSRTTNSTIRSRIGAANGNLLATLTANTTGEFEDTSNTDSIVSGNLVNTQLTTGGGSGNQTITVVSCDFDTANLTTHYWACGGPGAMALSSTYYFSVSGPNIGVANAPTEANTKAAIGAICTASHMSCFLKTNTVSATSTMRFRKNGANGNQVISITSNTAGYYEDSSNTDSLVAADLVNYSFVIGGSGTSIVMAVLGILVTFPAPSIVQRRTSISLGTRTGSRQAA